MKRQVTGRLGEELACRFLSANGYRVIERNFRCPTGEIDIVANHQGCLVFVEVRTRTSLAFGTPEESITGAKKGKLRASAVHYVQTHSNLPPEWRIDFVAIEMNSIGKPRRIEIYESAVGESDP